MTAPTPKEKTEEILGRLNSLRMMKVSEREPTLSGVEFTLRGLRNADPAAAVAFGGLVHSLRGDQQGLKAAADELVKKFPFEVDDLMNVHRTFTAFGDRENAAWIERHIESVDGTISVLPILSLNMLNLGDFERLEVLFNKYAADAAAFTPRGQGMIKAAKTVFDRFNEAGVRGEEVADLISLLRDVVSGFDRDLVPVHFMTPPEGMGEYAPAAMLTVDIDGTAEEAMSIEDAFWADARIATHSLVESCKVTVHVGFA